MTSTRLKKLEELPGIEDGQHCQLLPGGYVLVDPTETELKIISLFAQECQRLRPPMTATTQYADAG